MSGEEAEKKRSEEVVYQKIEEALLAMPEVSHSGLWLQGSSRALDTKSEGWTCEGGDLCRTA